jgi:hypothetical protein
MLARSGDDHTAPNAAGCPVRSLTEMTTLSGPIHARRSGNCWHMRMLRMSTKSGTDTDGCPDVPEVRSRLRVPAGFIAEATWPDEPYPSAAPWPFTVAEDVLICHAPHRVTFTADGVEYATARPSRVASSRTSPRSGATPAPATSRSTEREWALPSRVSVR